jgi:16S rRNA (uracil1498-N3)-methyltransferase
VHYFFDPEISETSTHIAKSELVHFKSLRINASEEIVITSGKGYGFSAVVIDPATGQVELGRKLAGDPKVEIHLVQAIAKGGRDEAALQASTELGISSATALQAERSVSIWGSKKTKNIERWEQIAIAAIKQSQQLSLPKIEFAAGVSELKPVGAAFVLDPRAELQIGEVAPSMAYTVVVGPEGGFTELELEKLVDRGFTRVRLGDSVLRTSTAGVVAISCLQLMSGRFGQRLD